MSLPEPSSIYAADICRDGGTLVLVYIDCYGLQHEVEVPIRKDLNDDVIGYWPPALKTYTTGDISSLTWEEAACLGKRLAPVIGEAIEWGGPDRARQVVEVLSLHGRLRTDA